MCRRPPRLSYCLAILLFAVLWLASVGSAPAGLGHSDLPGASTSPTRSGAPVSSAQALDREAVVRSDPTSAPAASAVLTSAGQSPAAIGLSWTDATTGTFTNYTILEASQMSGWGYSSVGVITAAGTTSFVVSGLSPATVYDWQVRENYQTCELLFCSSGSDLTNVLNLTQPSIAYLNTTGVTSTSATLNWTNNATYGSLISFGSYSVWEGANGGTASQVASITNISRTSYTASLTAGDGYSFFIKTSDCTAACGGSDPVLSVTQSNPITLGTPETLSVSVFAEHTEIDLGQSDFFTCTPNGGESPFAYAWDFGNGTYVSGNASESVDLGATGFLTVYCKITDSEPSTAVNSQTVEVNPALEVTIELNRSAADAGQVVGFDCTTHNGTTPYTVTWEFGDGGTSSMNDTSHSYSSRGNYAPSCIVYDAVGMEEAPSVPLVVSPRLDVVATSSSAAAAPGTTLTFTADPTNGSGTYTNYSWTFGSGAPVTGSEVHHAYSSAQEASATVQVIDSNGGLASGSVEITVSPIVLKASATASSVTSGGTVTFRANASGGAGGPYNYTWSFGDGHLGYGATVTHAYSATGRDTPTVEVRDRLNATNSTALRVITVSAGPLGLSWIAWATIGIVVAVVAILAVVLVGRRRRAEALELQKSAPPYVPPTDPKRTIFGSKLCAFCGVTNLPVRTTCRHCGKPLPRTRAS
jgi:PKD domain